MKIFVIASLFFCAASLVLYTFLPSSHQDIDSKAYLHHAQQFVEHGHFTGDVQPYYALGYALFLGCLHLVIPGIDLGSIQSTFLIIFVQLLLTLLCCWLIVRITRTIFGTTAARIAALMFACSVGYLVFVQFILTEVLLSLFLLLFVERFFAGALWAAGLALGISVLVKPAALLFIFPMVGLMVVTLRYILLRKTLPAFALRLLRRAGRANGFSCPFVVSDCEAIVSNHEHNWLSIFIFTLCFYLPILGYMTHNKIMFNTFSVSRLGTVNLYDWFLPNVLAAENGTTSDYERNILHKKYSHDEDFAERALLLKNRVLHNPFLIIRVWALNMFKTAAGLYTTNLKVLINPVRVGAHNSFFNTSGSIFERLWAYVATGADSTWVIALGIFEALWSVMRYILCCVGLYVLYRSRQWCVVLFMFLYVAYFFGITGHDGCARFRMMNEGVLIVLAAGGLQALCGNKKGKRKRS